VWNFSPPNPSAPAGQETSLKDFRKNLVIELFNETGQPVIRYVVYRCWVSEFQALPDLDANANAIAIQSIKLENEGWERDYTLAEPAEINYTEPAA
jgi:phage tail-like protein